MLEFYRLRVLDVSQGKHWRTRMAELLSLLMPQPVPLIIVSCANGPNLKVAFALTRTTYIKIISITMLSLAEIILVVLQQTRRISISNDWIAREIFKTISLKGDRQLLDSHLWLVVISKDSKNSNNLRMHKCTPNWCQSHLTCARTSCLSSIRRSTRFTNRASLPTSHSLPSMESQTKTSWIRFSPQVAK